MAEKEVKTLEEELKEESNETSDNRESNPSTKKDSKKESCDTKEENTKDAKKGIFKKKSDLEIEKLTLENQSLQDKVLRVTAEMQNMRRRMEEEKSQLLKYEGEDLIKMILPVADNFERAIGVNEDNLSEDIIKYLNGFKMIYSNLSNTLQSYQVEAIDCLNQPFDANSMEAVMVEENSDVEPNTVIQVLQKGYTYKGKVIRHAMVKVSK
ncbi:MAG: nucleotide exchange factor GrpE [Candidatus Coprovivens sp.]